MKRLHSNVASTESKIYWLFKWHSGRKSFCSVFSQNVLTMMKTTSLNLNFLQPSVAKI